jgi:ATP-binding cassette, subfamily B, bacterial CvaB/MchF/RaxB
MLSRRVPVILQTEAPECGIACVAMIATYHGFKTDLVAMRQRMSVSMKGTTLKTIAQIAETMKMSARGVKVSIDALDKIKLPAILHWDMNHFVVLTKVTGSGERQRITVHDPARGKRVLGYRDTSQHFTGVAMEMLPTPGFRKLEERERISSWRLLSSAAGYKSTIAQIFLLSLALEVFAIATPFFLQLVIDRVLVGRDADFLTVLGVAFAALVVIQSMVSALRAWVGVYLSTQINMGMLADLFAQLIRLPLAWFEKRNIGDIISRFRSIDAIQRTLTTTFVEAVIDGLMVVLTLGVMFFYSVTLTSVVLGAAILYGATRWMVYYPQRRATDEQLAHEAKSGTHFIETLRGMMAIKLNMREQERRLGYQNLVVEHVNAGVRVQQIAIVHRAANMLIFGIENVAVIWLGARAAMAGELTVGMLFAFLTFKLLFLTRINTLLDKLVEFRMLDLHAERIADIALTEPEAVGIQRSASSDMPLVVRAQRLGFSYGAEGFTFRNIDLEISAGETVALVGPSGSGKTTLIKVLTGLLQPTEGTLYVGGRDLREVDLGSYRSRIGVVMQDDQLFIGTIEDNISFFDPTHDAARARECARIAGLDIDIMAMPMQFNTIVGSLGVALSGGQKQRLLLARALYRGPEILFLDEAFDQLDLDREYEITDRLVQLGLGVVIVSHRPDTVRRVDRIIEIKPRVDLKAA